MSMIIDPYRFAAPAPPAGFDTSMLTGRTFVYSPDTSIIYQGTLSTASLATVDGDNAVRIDSGAGPATSRSLVNFNDANSMRLRIDTYSSVSKNLNTNQYVMYNTPAAGVNPSVVVPVSAIWGAGAKLFIFAGVINEARTDQGQPYQNDFVLRDGGAGYCGLHFYKSGTDVVMQWYSYTSGNRVITATVPLGQKFVLACRHGSSVLGVSLNNGAWSTLGSSGNTDSMTGQAGCIGVAATGTDLMRVAAMVSCDDANTNDANVAACCTSAGALMGLTI